jgi:ribonuclease HI
MSARERSSFSRLRPTFTSPPPSSSPRQSNHLFFPRTSPKGVGAMGAQDSQTLLRTRAPQLSPHIPRGVGAKGAQDSQTPLINHNSRSLRSSATSATDLAEALQKAKASTQDLKALSAAAKASHSKRVVAEGKAIVHRNSTTILTDSQALTSAASSARKVQTAANAAKLAALAAERRLEAAISTAAFLQKQAASLNMPSAEGPFPTKPLKSQSQLIRQSPRGQSSNSARNTVASDHEADSDLLQTESQYAEFPASDSDQPPATSPPSQQSGIRIRKRRPPQFKFPLSYPKEAAAVVAPPPYLAYNLDAAYFIDGSSVQQLDAADDPSKSKGAARRGSCAFLKHTPLRSMVYASKLEEATNNVAEFSALEKLLADSIQCNHRSILVVTDSQIVFDLLIGKNDLLSPHLKVIADRIKALLKQAANIYASKVFSHRRDTCLGNAIADSLCTWAIYSSKAAPLVLTLSNHSLSMRLLAINKSDPQCPKPEDPSSDCCAICLKKKDHNHSSCPIRRLANASVDAPLCLVCLSRDHKAKECTLYRDPKSRPALAKSTIPVSCVPNPNLVEITDVDFDTCNFPARQTLSQFSDYFETIFSTFAFAQDMQHQKAAENAIKAWNSNYRVSGCSIRRNRYHSGSRRHADTGDNLNSQPVSPEDLLAERALKAAALGVDARASDVSKALRSAPPIEITDAIQESLNALYPPSKSNETFEPKPLQGFHVNRHAVAKAILSRSRMSHPGTLGLNFAILQLYCKLTYGKETHDNPDPRWTTFCELISKIMSGNASLMSPMLHEVYGFCFDKNFEKPGAAPSIRNIGVEETLLRVPAALVFQAVIQDAIDRNFLTLFDLAAGRKAGAEIFAKTAQMASAKGAITAVMDVMKAFNFLRRKDIKAAVADLDNPLLTALVHYMFERDPHVTFTDRINGKTFVYILVEGILQGNPLSVFIFALTLAFILRPLRAKYQQHTIISAFVDDMLLISNPSQVQRYPEMLQDHFNTLEAHGLRFDFSDSAKTSVYSVKPLPVNVQRALGKMNIRCQTEGIAPCKCPFGTERYVAAFMSKATAKLQGRFDAFDALWNALLKYDAKQHRPTKHTHEYFLNLVRLSFLSMSTYTLRAVNPLLREPYTAAATRMAYNLISRVFPSPCLLPDELPSQLPLPRFPIDMDMIHKDIIQLPMSRGGLSCRFAETISDIAYISSCIDCENSLHAAAAALGFSFQLEHFGNFAEIVQALRLRIPTITRLVIDDARHSAGITCSLTTQQFLTRQLNDHEVSRITSELIPCPMYHYAFLARTDPRQDHSSWPFNPKMRATHSIGALEDANFSRAIQIATLRPVFLSARHCESCKQLMDPVGLHLLHCQNTHYTLMHEGVKRSLAQCFRNLFNSNLASLSVHVEPAVNRFAPLRLPLYPEGKVNQADIVLILSGPTQQDVFITDIVSALARTPNRRDSFYYDLAVKEQAKRNEYWKYLIPKDRFFPLAFGRTNVLARDTLRFCEVVGSYFPKSQNVTDKIRACLSRAISNSVAATVNEAMRKLQLSALNSVAFSMVPPAPDQCAKRHDSVRPPRPSSARISLSSNSSTSLNHRLIAIISRDDSRVPVAVAPLSCEGFMLSQQSVGLCGRADD